MAKASDADASAAIKAYMIKQNRPYSAIDVLNNLHKQFGKSQVIKTLDSLVESGDLREKLLSKQKIYYPNQDNFPVHDDSELQALDEKIKTETAQLKLVNDEQKILDAKLRDLKSSLTTEELKEREKSLQSDLASLSAKLEKMQSGAVTVTKEDKVKVEKEYENVVKVYRKRKAMANDILGAILENYPKKKKDLYEEIGIETDEDFKFKI